MNHPPLQEQPSCYRPLVPNGCRRVPWHDYRSRCIYMITINRAPGILPFSTLAGIPGSHDWKPRTALTPTGEIIASCISELKGAFPFIRTLRRVIMPERYEAYGNIHLLEDPDIEAVKISRKYTPEELIRRKRIWMRTVQNGGVLVSPFISPAEKKVENWACQEGGRIILITDNGFGTDYTPKGMLHTLCSEGRLLIIAPTGHRTASIALDRATCLQMNALAETVAAYSLHRL